MMKLKAGMVFAGHYEVVRVINAGGMGVVYEVTHRGTQRNRALKVMLPHVLEDAEMRDRFALEAVVTANIDSEHLVEVFDAGIDPESESPYIVMELLRGEDVGKRLERGGRYAEVEVLTYVDQIVRALEKTHARGIIHRDLKPENLFITKRDDGSVRIKVLDFGIAKLIKTTDAGNPKNTTRSFGTPYYVPREQLTGQAKLIGPPSDLYSLAHIVYTMLVGVPYFDGDEGAESNVLTLLNAVGRGTVEPASVRAKRQDATLPAGFDEWFAKATDLEPKKRFQTAIEFANALGNVLDPSRTDLVPTATSTLKPGSSLRVGAGTTRRADASAPTLPDLSQPSALAQSTDTGRDTPKVDARTPSQPPAVRGIAGSSQAFASSSLPSNTTDARGAKRTALFAIVGVALAAGVGYALLRGDEAVTHVSDETTSTATARSTAGPTVTVVDVQPVKPSGGGATASEAASITSASAPPSASTAVVRSTAPTVRKTAAAPPTSTPAVTATVTTTATPTSSRPERIR